MKRFTPLLLSLSMVLGILIGMFYTNHFAGNRLSIINTGSNKLNYLLQLIDNSYVDTVDINTLVEKALPEILAELDPHSAYIQASNAEEANEELRGNFSGIGVTFMIEKDTIVVMSTIPSGPSEKIGIMAGDRIVEIDGKPFVGQGVVSDTGAIHRLKGPADTEVKLVINRRGEKAPLRFTVTRGNIPVKSIDCAYMIDKRTGYIHVKNFGETTYAEMLNALMNFMGDGFENIIIDLRGNHGGLMQAAVQMVNEFLPKNQLIVYTEGRKSPREDLKSDGRGTFKDTPIVVLIDEGSASASEIFAGAIQDNDRGTIVGRRSFGKGLVQQPMEFRDGSQVRLTIARYYTPSGRCIQKPYVAGHGTEYENDLIARYERGEFFSQDSIKQTGPEYKTLKEGRIVYGGGGITPDVFVPEDTASITSYYKEALYLGLIRQFAFHYTDTQRERLAKVETLVQMKKLLMQDNVIDKFATFAAERGLARRNLQIRKSQPLFERYLYGAIIYDVFDADLYQQYLNLYDPVIDAALNQLNNKVPESVAR